MRLCFQITLLFCFFLCSCLENESSDSGQNAKEAENEMKNKILALEQELEVLRWENSRLSLKLRSVDGASLVRDIQTNLWHFDVERTLTREMRLRILKAVDRERKRLFSEVKEMGYSAIGTRTESLNRKVSGLMAKKTGFFDNGMKMDGCSRP